ncbi:MAG: hypothetical protein K9N51_11575 [Candidatus Pacebacteria bacterium]|nr:hypothetical protein [Candidatus Paceibacterota bacterium]
MEKKRDYDYESDVKWGNFVRRRFHNRLSRPAMRLCLLGIPYLERKHGVGFTGRVAASFTDIAEAGCMARTGLRGILTELQGIVAWVNIGSPVKGGKRATLIKRYTLPQLMQKEQHEARADAERLKQVLSGRDFTFNGKPCRPSWQILRTGRVQASEPNVQGMSKRNRAIGLATGLQDDDVLFCLDYRQAEPTIIQHLIGCSFREDIYNVVCEAFQYSRYMGKKHTNMLHYAKADPTKLLDNWPETLQDKLRAYTKQLEDYRNQLWHKGRKTRKLRRHTKTLTGRIIEADKAQQVHRGQLFSWHLQGSVADVLNAVCLRIIDQETRRGWRFLLPVHDSVYVIGKADHETELQSIMTEATSAIGVDLNVKIDLIHK